MTVNEQFFSIVIMAASGILIGAVIDATRICISALAPKSLLRKISWILEIIVWALLGVASFYIIFIIKGGEWRLVDPLSQILGIFLYESIFQPFFRFLGRLFIMLIVRPIIAFINFVFKMIRGMIRLLVRIIKIFIWPFYKLWTIIQKPFQRKFINMKRAIFKKQP
ncbi:spore cortex biosynthesis protein YabQ [Ureibacillus sp. FSL K6-8385]|uniref:Spore cortex biosynthesis protein YabQ n=1 Tax=Ureibacillus terrenus TaxID=118246 RepID=A0A540UY99_9BACL|nr:spore cortex biosynthesis protein YabQ [Ureibacillus terrenus]MED3662429.1 spore cortex biosynthesis protein YabQ [Ureibacillus terrenus]MED3763197.1 spore cortex biosynthesis protein YabQ [Ureibacillus terrenus]TQE89466.1 hypothetical protein FKZ59_12120 [Ureibacillus terrenus]